MNSKPFLSNPVSRRAVLRGMGVSLALPLFESLIPRCVRAEASKRTQRYIAMYFPVGVTDLWWPSLVGESDAWQLSPVLSPLADIKSRVNVYSGIQNSGVVGTRMPVPSHSRLGAAFLTCADCAEGDVAKNGTSIDQIVAAALRGSTVIDSLQLGTTYAESSEDGRHPANSRSISWASSTRPLYKTVSPAAVFDSLMVGRAPDAASNTAELAQQRRTLGLSSLDFVIEDARALARKLSGADRTKLDHFLESVRELEKRLDVQTTTVSSGAQCPQVSRPTDISNRDPSEYSRREHFDMMSDLVVLALQCDLTRVISFMLDDARSDFVYGELNVRQFVADGSTDTGVPINVSHHATSHSAAEVDSYRTINYFFAECLARISGKLAAVPDGENTLLDNTLIVFGSGIQGPTHRADRLPVLSVGSAGGVLKVGQHLAFPQERPLADLHLTLAQRCFGVEIDAFANSSGIIEELLV